MMDLKGQSVYLRALEPDDSELILKWENNMEVWQVSDTLLPYSKYTIEQYVNSIQDIYTTKQLRLIICLIADGTAIGAVDLFDYNPTHSRAGIGILIADKQFRNQGLASDALAVMLEYCFSVLFLNQLYCNISQDNEPSLNLFLKHQFQVVGILKSWRRSAQGYSDEYFLQCLNYYAAG
jgi:diamine N-acetyltransferase